MDVPTVEQQFNGFEFGDIVIERDWETHNVIVLDVYKWDNPEVLAEFSGDEPDAWEKGMKFILNLDPRMTRKGGWSGNKFS